MQVDLCLLANRVATWKAISLGKLRKKIFPLFLSRQSRCCTGVICLPHSKFTKFHRTFFSTDAFLDLFSWQLCALKLIGLCEQNKRIEPKNLLRNWRHHCFTRRCNICELIYTKGFTANWTWLTTIGNGGVPPKRGYNYQGWKRLLGFYISVFDRLSFFYCVLFPFRSTASITFKRFPQTVLHRERESVCVSYFLVKTLRLLSK